MGALCGIWPGTLMIYFGGCLLGFVFFPLSEPDGRLGDIEQSNYIKPQN